MKQVSYCSGHINRDMVQYEEGFRETDEGTLIYSGGEMNAVINVNQ